jgi:hypothetical protein
VEHRSIDGQWRHAVPGHGQRIALRAGALRRALQPAAFVLLALVLCAGPALAQSAAGERMQGLDEQVQEIKSDVLAIAAELSQLEERLLYPSDTQVAVFVAIAPGDGLELDSVQITIDGEPVARHVYSFKELEALRKGGVQRIHTENLPSGDHAIEVSALGTLPGGGAFAATRSFRFEKDAEPGLVEITLAGQESGEARIQLGNG